VSNVYILSAGWGLIEASFLTPQYDITFSQSAEETYIRRRTGDHYRDFCRLRKQDDDIAFLGGKDYVSLFCSLTSAFPNKRPIRSDQKSHSM
jgi:hypothetical protein